MLEWCLLPATDPVGPGSEADLGITLIDLPDPVNAGDELTFIATVGNFGPDTATGVVVELALPPELGYSSFRSVHPESGNVPLGSDWSCTGSAGTVSCELAGTLAYPAMAPILEVITTVNAAAVPGSISTSASVSSDLDDPATGNNTVVIQTEVSGAADVIFANGFE